MGTPEPQRRHDADTPSSFNEGGVARSGCARAQPFQTIVEVLQLSKGTAGALCSETIVLFILAPASPLRCIRSNLLASLLARSL